MRKIAASILLLLLIIRHPSLAQVAVNTDASLPDASAMLDVKSTSKGMLVPRVTTAQRTAFVAPAEGLWVYDTDTKTFWYYSIGPGWQQIANSIGSLTLPFSGSANSASTLFSITNLGTGGAISGSSTGGTAVYGATGVVSAAGVLGDNLNGGEAVTGRTASVGGTPTGAVVGRNDGPGYGVKGFIATDNSGTGIGILGQVGVSGSTGIAGHFENLNASNAQTALEAVTNGTGNGATITNTNNTSTANTLDVTTNGPGVIANHSTGNAGNFFNNNTSGVGAGVRGEVNSIFGNNGTAGVYGVASGTGGYAGYFEHTETTGFGVTLQVVTNDLGTAMVVDHGGSGDLAIFQAGGLNVARIDHTGRGFFNGGTQNSGADLAEAFDVEGNIAAYEPGDVLLISTTADRMVVRSNTAYSSLVAGVYATKPGVLLTEETMNSSLAGKVPMGVVGVIPTKVCNEGGPVHRGDILVTSGRPGYAMKADYNRLQPGQAIGKALEEFNGTTGKIRVLVNVR